VQENKFTNGTARGYVSPCAKNLLPPDEEIRNVIINYLEQYEYDVSSLR
jgi:hypothetical protein